MTQIPSREPSRMAPLGQILMKPMKLMRPSRKLSRKPRYAHGPPRRPNVIVNRSSKTHKKDQNPQKRTKKPLFHWAFQKLKATSLLSKVFTNKMSSLNYLYQKNAEALYPFNEAKTNVKAMLAART